MSQSKANAGQFQPGVVIAAEIAFAAVLLYLTNHPVSLDEFTQAENSTNDRPALFETPTPHVAVASSAIGQISQPAIK